MSHIGTIKKTKLNYLKNTHDNMEEKILYVLDSRNNAIMIEFLTEPGSSFNETHLAFIKSLIKI